MTHREYLADQVRRWSGMARYAAGDLEKEDEAGGYVKGMATGRQIAYELVTAHYAEELAGLGPDEEDEEDEEEEDEDIFDDNDDIELDQDDPAYPGHTYTRRYKFPDLPF